MSDERDWLATNDPVLAILTDLIAELRGEDGYGPACCIPSDPNEDGQRMCVYHYHEQWPCRLEAAVCRAEERLKELNNE